MLLFIIEEFHQNRERIFINIRIGNLGEKKEYKYNVKVKKKKKKI